MCSGLQGSSVSQCLQFRPKRISKRSGIAWWRRSRNVLNRDESWWIVYAMPGWHYCESTPSIVESSTAQWGQWGLLVLEMNIDAVSMHDTAFSKVWWSNWVISTESGTHGWLRDTWQSGVSFCTKGSLVDKFKTFQNPMWLGCDCSKCWMLSHIKTYCSRKWLV